MMEFFQQLPHLEPYGNPQYFVYVIAATLPIFIGLFFKKRFAWYEVLVSLFFIVTMLVGGKTNQLAALGIYLCWEILLLLFYKHYRKSKDGKWVFYLVSFLSLLPIIFVKVQPAINGTQSLLGFLGISYLTFRSVGIIIELRDGVILPSGNSSVSFSSCQLSRVVQSIALSDLMKIIRLFLSEMS